ncbi:hypothetical protein [Streptomyces flavalbus]|uniref:Uncharacterized protein n=1 Tax=Streptomyces flavalbus TaxID=2665155 RepID=A0ABW2W4J6_9ACTN
MTSRPQTPVGIAAESSDPYCVAADAAAELLRDLPRPATSADRAPAAARVLEGDQR